MPYYITHNGQVRHTNQKDRPYDTEKFGFYNWFSYNYDAYAMRDIIEENFPRAYLNL
jgi:hypothetical protein